MFSRCELSSTRLVVELKVLQRVLHFIGVVVRCQ